MVTRRFATACTALSFALTGAAQAGKPATGPKAIEVLAHDAYLAAINSNDLDTPLADVSDDIVYQSPNEPEITGKAALRIWAAAYIEAYRFKWEKTSIGFTVSGDRAFERYAYKATNTDKKTGEVSTDQMQGHQHLPSRQGWPVARRDRRLEFEFSAGEVAAARTPRGPICRKGLSRCFRLIYRL